MANEKKKQLMTGDVKDFIANIQNQKEAPRKSPTTMRSQKAHHKRSI